MLSLAKGVIKMPQAMVNIRMDDEVKKNMEQACKELGLSMTAAFTIYAIKVGREKRIPFEVSIDPFYSPENIAELKRRIADLENGTATLVAHELIEV